MKRFLQQLGHANPHLSCGLFNFDVNLLIEVSNKRKSHDFNDIFDNFIRNIVQAVIVTVSYMATIIQYDAVAYTIRTSITQTSNNHSIGDITT